ncbi:MAG: nucleotide exchange factor GrpE [Eubacteriales bacterium]|nr:nucleotide exchange factor GrpE [Eubacteriales bacterium]
MKEQDLDHREDMQAEDLEGVASQSNEDNQVQSLQDEALQKALQERDEYLLLAQKVQAEFENYRRRNQKIRAEAFDDGAIAFIRTVLPVCDDLERAIQAAEGESEESPLHTGVKLVYRKLMDALNKRGVEEIDRLGEKFDPYLEEAVAQGNPDEGEPGTVSAVIQKGYKLNDYVIRHAMVKVVAE